MQRITRDPQPGAIAEFALQSSVLIALIKSVSSCIDLYSEKKKLLHGFISTALERVGQSLYVTSSLFRLNK